MWLLVAPRAAKVLMVMRASGSSRPILASTPRNGVVRGSQPETTARKSGRRLTRRCPVALQTLRRLKLGCVARQMEQPDPVWNAKVRFGVPAGLVQHEHDAALAAGPAFPGEGRKERGEERLGDAGGEIPDRLAREGLGEGRDVKPLVAVMAERDRALALGRPDAAQDRLQAEAVLVGRKHLDREVGTARGLFGNDFVEFFLNVDSSSGVAAFG